MADDFINMRNLCLSYDEYFKTQISTKEKEIKKLQAASNERIIKNVNLEIE